MTLTARAATMTSVCSEIELGSVFRFLQDVRISLSEHDHHH
jgi:hypothetical protein